ncbi:tryptophan halogenase [Asticcacaulis biprosthecium C19]|uniref:Tryptophan halogenase n=1 Tax=Asticcacaulis biprosthecium C19 TaxID=715226 RepID=F4QGE7_9CAUL|nr:tryptophan halogenase family protein [Asticcacaulis biprosthecium]EGF93628.1 tryptophan halogenase [Asticcacaulis biprosthecium C19]
MPEPIRKIVIAGGGTAGWMCAAALRTGVPAEVEITLVESEDIGIIGVGEATIPTIRDFNELIGLEEGDFVRRTEATFKLGIDFVGWGTKENRYFHGFGDFGAVHQGLEPHQMWRRLKAAGDPASLFDWSMPTQLAYAGKFFPPNPNPKSALRDYTYAFHFDASLYAAYLRELCEKRGVKRINARIANVGTNAETGFLTGLALDDGRFVDGDFFIDCTGFRGLLIEGALKAGYTDWSHWLPVDRAWAVPCARSGTLTPYTSAMAHEAGWQWRIPLQHRTGNGHVFSSRFMDEQAAADVLLQNLDGKALKDPMLVRFLTGHRNRFWAKNCICAGLASGFLEPLESTSINLIQTAVVRFLEHYPDKGPSPVLEAEYNRKMQLSYERVRDFIILHYVLQSRDDGELWRYTRNMAMPDTLAYKIELFRARGIPLLYDYDHFHQPSWISVFVGQGLIPESYDPLVDRLPLDQVQSLMRQRREQIAAVAAKLPAHEDFIRAHCPSPSFLKAS